MHKETPEWMSVSEMKGENVLVTGGAGFMGSALVRELLSQGANVIAYDNFLSGDIYNLTEIQGLIKIIKGDVRDPRFENILQENKVEWVFHLAAEPYIPYCYYRPREFIDVNFMGTLNVLMACEKARIKRIVYYSTSEVYGSAKYVPMDENHPTNPLSTYAVSKLAADRLCYTFHHEHGVPVVILRQFNCYGPRETQPYIIPEIITQLFKGNKLKLGNIKARRDFTYVEDAAKGAIELMKHDGVEGETFNLGYGEDYSMEEVANIIAELMGYDSVPIEIDPKRLRPLDVEKLQCNFSKANEYVGYKPRVSLRDGLNRTIEWFKQNGKKWIWETKIVPEEKLWVSD